jgi:signal transduction histidine kinase
VSVDPTELDQAVLNLTVNARDAMPPRASDHPTGVATRADSPFAFRVADTGTGIDPELMPRLFEPSSRRKRQGSAPGSAWRWCATSSTLRRRDRGPD